MLDSGDLVEAFQPGHGHLQLMSAVVALRTGMSACT